MSVPWDRHLIFHLQRDNLLCSRRVFVWSSARAGAAAKSREKKLARARGDLERLGGNDHRFLPRLDH